MSRRYTVAVDFDGVLHAYTSPWTNAWTIPDPPIFGAIEWLADAVRKFDVVIFSTRCRSWRGRLAIRAWLKKHCGSLYYDAPGYPGVENVKLAGKPMALMYIDDRAYRFEGRFPTADEIHSARPWNKTRGGS